MVKNKFFKKAAVAGLATVMTVAGSVMAFANNTTMYVGDDSVDCELTLPYEGARATMDSSSELEMKIDGQAYNPYGSYTLSAYSSSTYGISAYRHSEIGFDSAAFGFVVLYSAVFPDSVNHRLPVFFRYHYIGNIAD